ncbi:MAG: site-specific DNA-methyltransferase [Thermotogota bacterium]|nr:site-specific DNA-methyltransferase [Thermotogota bacterium]
MIITIDDLKNGVDPVGKIINADCIEAMGYLKDESVDLVVTDPPYGLNYNNGDLAHNWEKVFGGNTKNMVARPILNDDEKTANKVFRNFLKQAKRLLKYGACCCCCCGGGGPKPLFALWTLWMDKYLTFKQACVWNKGGLGMGLHYRRSYEFMLIAYKPGKAVIWNGGKKTSNIFYLSKIIPNRRQHPTEKPISLMGKYILLHSNKGDLVLDPFLGHGGTLVAAEHLNRKWIGIEMSLEYCKIAEKRIKAEQAQGRLF